MLNDCRELALSSHNSTAVAHLDATVDAYLRFDRDTGKYLKRALAADPEFSLAHCVRGYFLLMFMNPLLDSKARQSLEAAGKSGHLTARERWHCQALAAWVDGDMNAAAAILECILIACPRDLLALRVAHFLHFYSGNALRMRDSVARVMHAWDAGVPGYPRVLGMLAFALEECGAGFEAERIGRQAVDSDPDPWAIHAVAHVMEMQDRRRAGIHWLRQQQQHFESCNNFAYHLWWHLALHHLDLGQYEAVLALYDDHIRADKTDDYLDLSNAASLLWRLQERGIAIGDRFDELAHCCRPRLTDQRLPFADTHYRCIIAAANAAAPTACATADGDRAADCSVSPASAAIDSTSAAINSADGLSQSLGAATAAWYAGDYRTVVTGLLPLRERITVIGGSNTQRDMFNRLLIDAAVRDHNHPLACALLSERRQLRPNNIWAWQRYAEVLEAMGDPANAAAASARVQSLLRA